jgi:hypothetical protein
MSIYIEETILNSVRSLLLGRVNELLGETEYPIPPVEFGSYRGGSVVLPAIRLSVGERSEKERIIRADVYTVTITFIVAEGPSDQRSVRPRSVAERYCYAYAASVAAALREDPTLGGTVDRAELTGKKYTPPKQSGTGGEWELALTLRITAENP